VLSIGKIAAGAPGTAGAYYVEAVAQGAEDYYLGAGEAPGEWVAGGAGDLGLDGLVRSEDFLAVLSGIDPATGEQLGRAGGTVAGFDATFSAPKSVSVLYGLGSAEINQAARDAHDAAVRAALSYLEANASSTRRGAGGVTRMTTSGFVAGIFRHRTSRACDPQLHSHVVIANRVRGEDGRWSRLDARALYAHARTAGFLYQAHLRYELAEALGVEWGPVRNGQAEITGTPEELLAAFSRRRAEIKAAMAERGTTTASGAQAAALDTRRAKNKAPRFEEPALAGNDAKDYSAGLGGPIAEEWHQRAAGLGFGPEDLAALCQQPAPPPLDTAALLDHLVSTEGLTAQASTFSRRDVLQAISGAATKGLSVADVEGLTEELLGRSEIVQMIGVPKVDTSLRQGDVIRRGDGIVVSAGTDTARYSTAELLNAEATIMEIALRTQDASVAVVDPSAAIARRPGLGEDQAAMVATLTTSGAGVDVVVGRAGTGKTYALAAAQEAWSDAGVTVLGAALAARTARQLETDAAISSTTLARRLLDLDAGGLALNPNTVVVLDEAGMVGTRDLARLVAHVEAAGAKLVLVGDDRQLPEIDAGGAFRGLLNRLPVSELANNRRQADAWERQALEELRHGDVAAALNAYNAHGRVTIDVTPSAQVATMTTAWWEARQAGQDVLLLAYRRAEVRSLNIAAQARREAAGELGDVVARVGGQELRQGDTVMVLRNDRTLGLINGDRATVEGLDGDGLRLARSDGRSVTLPPEKLTTKHLGLGYASTVHKAQGATADVALCLGSDRLFRELTYTAASRGRHENRFFLVAGDTNLGSEADRRRGALAHLGRSVERSRAKTMATDTGVGVPQGLLVETMGPRPSTGPGAQEWDRNAALVASYRQRYGITDPSSLLGRRPDHPAAAGHYDLVKARLTPRSPDLGLDLGL